MLGTYVRAKGEILMRDRSCLKVLGAMAAAGLLVTFGLDASAQDAMKKAPAKAAKPASACKGLEDTACKAKAADCTWVVPKAGKQKPYCRAKPAKKT